MKNFNIVDIIIVLGVIAVLIVGVVTMKHFRQTADKQIEATSAITFQVVGHAKTIIIFVFGMKIKIGQVFQTSAKAGFYKITANTVIFKIFQYVGIQFF